MGGDKVHQLRRVNAILERLASRSGLREAREVGLIWIESGRQIRKEPGVAEATAEVPGEACTTAGWGCS